MDLLTNKVFAKLSLSDKFKNKTFLEQRARVRVMWLKVNNAKSFFAKEQVN